MVPYMGFRVNWNMCGKVWAMFKNIAGIIRFMSGGIHNFNKLEHIWHLLFQLKDGRLPYIIIAIFYC